MGRPVPCRAVLFGAGLESGPRRGRRRRPNPTKWRMACPTKHAPLFAVPGRSGLDVPGAFTSEGARPLPPPEGARGGAGEQDAAAARQPAPRPDAGPAPRDARPLPSRAGRPRPAPAEPPRPNEGAPARCRRGTPAPAPPRAAMVHVQTVLDKLASTDTDLRYMATSDLMIELQKNPSFAPEPRHQVRRPGRPRRAVAAPRAPPPSPRAGPALPRLPPPSLALSRPRLAVLPGLPPRNACRGRTGAI